MNDVSLLSLRMDLTAVAGNDGEIAEGRYRIRRRPGLTPLGKMQAADKLARGDRIVVQRVGDRYRVCVEYTLGGRRFWHESLPVFRTEAEARDRGEHYLLTVWAKEI